MWHPHLHLEFYCLDPGWWKIVPLPLVAPMFCRDHAGPESHTIYPFSMLSRKWPGCLSSWKKSHTQILNVWSIYIQNWDKQNIAEQSSQQIRVFHPFHQISHLKKSLVRSHLSFKGAMVSLVFFGWIHWAYVDLCQLPSPPHNPPCTHMKALKVWTCFFSNASKLEKPRKNPSIYWRLF